MGDLSHLASSEVTVLGVRTLSCLSSESNIPIFCLSVFFCFIACHHLRALSSSWYSGLNLMNGACRSLRAGNLLREPHSALPPCQSPWQAPLASFQQAAIFSPGSSVGRSHMAGKPAAHLTPFSPLLGEPGRHHFHSGAKGGFLSGKDANSTVFLLKHFITH